jgi:mono/diheme cytochrome c family protein
MTRGKQRAPGLASYLLQRVLGLAPRTPQPRPPTPGPRPLAVLFVVLIIASSAFATGDPEHGRAVFAMAGGCGCHSLAGGPVGSGGRQLSTPFGTFYSTNITPDPETGLGHWTDEEIIAAIRGGDLRDGSVETPVMPYYLYAGMADRDVRDLVSYLRTLPAVRRENRKHEVAFPFARVAFRIWRLLFAPSGRAPAEAPADGVERGHYLADHVAICQDCHTPRNRFGAPNNDMYLAGTNQGPGGKPVPNVTPDAKTGIGDWDEYDIVQVLDSGMMPNFDNVQGLMAEVVDGVGGGPGYGDAPNQDLVAIAKYLKTIKPIRNEVSGD